MKKSELKKVLKPIVKECIQEALLEEGLLSNVISEVVKGLGGTQQPIVEQKQNDDEIKKLQLQERQKRLIKINETKQRMLDAINKDAYKGVDIFEGTTPMSKGGSLGDGNSPQGPLSGIAPGDPGVDISKFMGNSSIWKAITKG